MGWVRGKFSKKIERKVHTMGRYTTRSLEESEYRKIILLMRTGYEYNGVKHRPNDQIATILVLQANLGCRIGDIMALTTDSIIKDGNIHRLDIVEQKTGKKRYFIVPQPIVDFIEDYKRCNGIHSGRLFDIKSPAVWKQLRAVTGYIGISNISAHSFRKKFACDLFERTNHDIMTVCQALQHSSTTITQVYIKRSDEQMENALNNIVSIA
jgi:integrase